MKNRTKPYCIYVQKTSDDAVQQNMFYHLENIILQYNMYL